MTRHFFFVRKYDPTMTSEEMIKSYCEEMIQYDEHIFLKWVVSPKWVETTNYPPWN